MDGGERSLRDCILRTQTSPVNRLDVLGGKYWATLSAQCPDFHLCVALPKSFGGAAHGPDRLRIPQAVGPIFQPTGHAIASRLGFAFRSTKSAASLDCSARYDFAEGSLACDSTEMIRAWRNANLFIAITAALCLGACASETPPNEPFLALAQALGFSAPSCPTIIARDGGTHSNCADTRAAPIGVSRADNPAPTFDPPHRDNIAEEEPTSVPHLNVEASCRYAGDIGAEPNVNRCLLDENSARDQLNHSWNDFPVADRSQCSRSSTKSGGGTYSDLLTCLEMSRYARELHAKNRAFARQ